MKLAFTKMQGAGNDFVVLDCTREPFALSQEQIKRLAHRQFGISCDQILVVERPQAADADFRYRIFNADGGEVEQCGNGARCFLRYVRDKGLTDRDVVRVRTLSGVIEPRLHPDGRVTVDMGAPVFDLPAVPFDGAGLDPQPDGGWHKWKLALGTRADAPIVPVAVLSMGNPHAV